MSLKELDEKNKYGTASDDVVSILDRVIKGQPTFPELNTVKDREKSFRSLAVTIKEYRPGRRFCGSVLQALDCSLASSLNPHLEIKGRQSLLCRTVSGTSRSGKYRP